VRASFCRARHSTPPFGGTESCAHHIPNPHFINLQKFAKETTLTLYFPKLILPVALAMCTMAAGCVSSNNGGAATQGTTSSSGSTGSSGGSGTTSGAATTSGTTTGAATGGSTTGGGSLSAYETAFNAANGQLPTLTPITGNATYTGEVNILTNANTGNAQESVTGDLAMAIDFGPNVARPINATVNNIAGKVNGVQTSIAGELSTANAPTGVNAITTSVVNVAGQPTTLTGMSTELQGTLNDPTSTLSGDALMTLQGSFRGNDGAAVSGASAVAIRPNGAPNIITGGTFYANKN
jgi:hypothetical protein